MKECPTKFQGEDLKLSLSFKTHSPPLSPPSLSSLSKPLSLFCLLCFFTLGGEQNLTNTHSSCSVSLQHKQTYSAVDQLLLASFYCIFLLQISISMNWRGPWSQSSGYWCFCTVGKLPPLLKKIESHTPDETPPDKSQHETHQASLSGRRQVMKQVQRKTIVSQSALYPDC